MFLKQNVLLKLAYQINYDRYHSHPDNKNIPEQYNLEQLRFLGSVETYLQALTSGLNPQQELLLLHGGHCLTKKSGTLL